MNKDTPTQCQGYKSIRRPTKQIISADTHNRQSIMMQQDTTINYQNTESSSLPFLIFIQETDNIRTQKVKTNPGKIQREKTLTQSKNKITRGQLKKGDL